MSFTHDTRVTLSSAAALVNSAPGWGSGDEQLADAAAVTEFLRSWNWSRLHVTAADVEILHRLRDRLRLVWTAPVEELVTEINQILIDGRALPQLVEHGQDYGWHVHATRDDDPVGVTMAVEIAMALVDLVRSGETDRLRRCAASDCDDVLIDLSRNRSRRYCEGTCANNAHVAAYRARRNETA